MSAGDFLDVGCVDGEEIAEMYLREMRAYDAPDRKQETLWFTELDALYHKHVACIRLSKRATNLVIEATRPRSALGSDPDDEAEEDTGYDWLRFWWRERNWRKIDRGLRLIDMAVKEVNRDEDELRELRAILSLVSPYSERATGLRQEIVKHNLRLVVSLLGAYELDERIDVIQEGNIGLIHAVDKFFLKKGWKFATYAMFWIRASARRYMAAQFNDIRLPSHMADRMISMKKFISDFCHTGGRYPTAEEIASHLGCGVDSVRNLLFVWGGCVSLSQAPADKRPLEEVLELESDFSFDELVNNLSRRHLVGYIQEAFTNPRDRAIIDAHFGLTSGYSSTFDEVADHLVGLGYDRITGERVRQLEAKAFRRVKTNPVVRKLFCELTVG